MQNVLMTGAAGGIGTRFRPLLRNKYPRLRLSDINTPADLQADEEFVQADLADINQVEKIVAGIDGIVHFGGFSVEGPWEVIHQANIIGLYNLYEAARRQGVQRVVFASSNHAIGFYRRTRKIGVNEPVKPDSRYGVSKAFGEALASLYADKYGIRSLCIRIGNVDDKPADHRRLSIWIHPDDLVQLVHIGLTHPDLHYQIVYGESANERSWWDNKTAYDLGYAPRYKAEDHVGFAMAEQTKLAADPIGDRFHGGPFCSAEFAGRLDDIT